MNDSTERKENTNLRKQHFPYCLKRLTNDSYVILNRNYKPLGFSGNSWVDYSEHPIETNLKLTDEEVSQLSWNGDPSRENIFLYNDGCIPNESQAAMNAYLKKLTILMKKN